MSKEAMEHALEVAEGIVSSDWRKWRELASPAEFERWAKQRAYHVATILRKALAELPAQQKPVAWMDEKKRIVYWHNTHDVDDYHGFKRTTPLYESPPQRPWVGLTYEEGNDIAFNFDVPWIVVWTVENKLKEKNT